jgi:hypothetical protein
MSNLTAQQIADKWATGVSQSTEALKAGINAVTESPMEKAASAVDRQVAGVIAAAQSGKTAARLRSVSMEQWKQAMLTKGVSRVAGGAAAAKPKFAQFMSEFMPFIRNIVSGLPPRGDLETNIQRATAVMRGASGFRRSA